MQLTDQDGLDLVARQTRVLLAELDADTGRASTLRARRGNPDHVSRHRDLLLAVHQREQHEDFFTELVGTVAGDENATALHVRHVGGVQRALVFDRERQHTGPSG